LVRMCTDDGLTGWSEAITMWPEACAAVKAPIDGGLGTVVPGDHGVLRWTGQRFELEHLRALCHLIC
jgi:hypothetical protein